MHSAMVIGTGSALPHRILTNNDLEKMVDTSDEWIRTRTGIRTRHIAGKGEETSKLASSAARKALDMAGIPASDLDIIIVGTITSEISMPSCACLDTYDCGGQKSITWQSPDHQNSHSQTVPYS